MTNDFEMQPTAPRSYEDRVRANFNKLYSLNLNDKTEKKNDLRYLSWSSAWAEFKKVFPMATFTVKTNPATNLPYFVDPAVGIFVTTSVTADGMTYEMTLPVLDSANKAMKATAYKYQVWDKTKKCYVDRTVEAATSFDINRATLRSLTKCLSLFGLGLYIYQGEDFPEELHSEETPKPSRKDRFEVIKEAIMSIASTDALVQLYREHENEIKARPEILALLTRRKEELMAA